MVPFDNWSDQLKLLDEVMGSWHISSHQKELKEIYDYSERKWGDNLLRLQGKKVRYLLIAEAPPWPKPRETKRYFYDIDEHPSHMNELGGRNPLFHIS